MAKAATVRRRWVLIDATDVVVGRLAADIASVLRGKHKPEYTPHCDTGDYVIVVNAERVRFSGRKWEQKEYQTYSHHAGGQKCFAAREMLSKRPTEILRLAVKRMMPKGPLAYGQLSKLKLFAGPTHHHQAQQPFELLLPSTRAVIRSKRTVRVASEVRLILVGEPLGVSGGWVLQQLVHWLLIDYPRDAVLPVVRCDVSGLGREQVLLAEALALPNGCRLVAAPTLPVARVVEADIQAWIDELPDDATGLAINQTYTLSLTAALDVAELWGRQDWKLHTEWVVSSRGVELAGGDGMTFEREDLEGGPCWVARAHVVVSATGKAALPGLRITPRKGNAQLAVLILARPHSAPDAPLSLYRQFHVDLPLAGR
jgi:large subunit ribosomal protein L13